MGIADHYVRALAAVTDLCVINEQQQKCRSWPQTAAAYG